MERNTYALKVRAVRSAVTLEPFFRTPLQPPVRRQDSSTNLFVFVRMHSFKGISKYRNGAADFIRSRLRWPLSVTGYERPRISVVSRKRKHAYVPCFDYHILMRMSRDVWHDDTRADSTKEERVRSKSSCGWVDKKNSPLWTRTKERVMHRLWVLQQSKQLTHNDRHIRCDVRTANGKQTHTEPTACNSSSSVGNGFQCDRLRCPRGKQPRDGDRRIPCHRCRKLLLKGDFPQGSSLDTTSSANEAALSSVRKSG